MNILDAFFGDLRLWRRLRGGRWIFVVHVPSMFIGWLRADGPKGSEVVERVEDYRIPRAKALP